MDLLAQVKAATGADDASAHDWVAATLRALGRSLPPASLGPIRSALPRALRPHLGDGATEVPSAETFYRWVAAEEAATEELGEQHARVVCRALAGALDAEQCRTLPSPFDVLLEAPKR